jgi:hypothetical protein
MKQCPPLLALKEMEIEVTKKGFDCGKSRMAITEKATKITNGDEDVEEKKLLNAVHLCL